MHWLLIGYMYLFIHRPFEIWPELGEYRIERIYMFFTMTMWAVYPNKRWIPNIQQMAYVAFAFSVAACWGLSPWIDEGQHVTENWFKVLVFFYMFVTVVHDEKTLRMMVGAYLCVMAFYLLHSLREYMLGRHTHRMSVARMIGVDASMGDPNTFGSSILYSLPLVTVFWVKNATRNVRWGLLGYVSLAVLCLLLTGSRSSFMGLLVLTLILIGKSQRLWTYLLLGAMFAPFVFLALPPNLQLRFETIIHPEVGPANAQESADGRYLGLVRGFELWSQYPLSGCGPGAWRPATRAPIEAHNLYGQLVGEMGTLGLFSFGFLIVTYWSNIRQMKRLQRRTRTPSDDFLFRLSRAVGISVFLMLLMGNFGHNLFRYNWLWFGGFLIVARHCVNVRLRRIATLPMAMSAPRWVPMRPSRIDAAT